jgi:hypothetical protein
VLSLGGRPAPVLEVGCCCRRHGFRLMLCDSKYSVSGSGHPIRRPRLASRRRPVRGRRAGGQAAWTWRTGRAGRVRTATRRPEIISGGRASSVGKETCTLLARSPAHHVCLPRPDGRCATAYRCASRCRRSRKPLLAADALTRRCRHSAGPRPVGVDAVNSAGVPRCTVVVAGQGRQILGLRAEAAGWAQ